MGARTKGGGPERAERALAEARRLLAEGRLTVAYVDGSYLAAVCRTDRGVVDLGYEEGRGWWCTCGSGPRCPHLLALDLVTRGAVRPRGGPPVTLEGPQEAEGRPARGTDGSGPPTAVRRIALALALLAVAGAAGAVQWCRRRSRRGGPGQPDHRLERPSPVRGAAEGLGATGPARIIAGRPAGPIV